MGFDKEEISGGLAFEELARWRLVGYEGWEFELEAEQRAESYEASTRIEQDTEQTRDHDPLTTSERRERWRRESYGVEGIELDEVKAGGLGLE